MTIFLFNAAYNQIFNNFKVAQCTLTTAQKIKLV